MTAAARLKFGVTSGDYDSGSRRGAQHGTDADTTAAESLKFGAAASAAPRYESEPVARGGLGGFSPSDTSQNYSDGEEGIELQDVEANESEGFPVRRPSSRRKKDYEEYDEEDEYGMEIQDLGDDPYAFNSANIQRDHANEGRKASDDGWRSLCMLCTCMSCIIIIGLSIGLGKASSESSAEGPPPEVIIKSNPPSVFPTIAPTMPPVDFVWCYESNESVALGNDRYASIRSALVSSGTSRDDEFSDDESYQRRSLCWLAFGDRLELDATDPFLEQRYVLATIYYGLNQPTTLFVDGWLSGKPECEWHPMVECDSRSDTTVTRLNLRGNDLAGDLPKEMAALQHVTYLDMSSNLLYGDISLVVGGWTHLEELKLSSNNFVSIPENLES
ncbi:hypothetical protein ACHAXR_003292, partial [Thalassiosira sp. AJA248-18]